MSDTEKGGFLSKVIGPKRQWREYKARARQLPASYRTAMDALERYLNYLGGMDEYRDDRVLPDPASSLHGRRLVRERGKLTVQDGVSDHRRRA